MQLVQIPNSKSSFLIENPHIKSSQAVIFLPGISGGALTEKYQSFVDAGLSKGFAVVRINAWKNVEDVKGKNLTEIQSDINYVIKYLQENGYSTLFGVGKSFGGTLLLTLFSANKDISKLVLWSPVIGIADKGSNVDTYKSTHLGSLDTLQDMYVDKEYLKDKTVDMLIIHGDMDENIPISNSEKLISMLPNAKIIRIQGADHSFSNSKQEKALHTATFDFLSQ